MTQKNETHRSFGEAHKCNLSNEAKFMLMRLLPPFSNVSIVARNLLKNFRGDRKAVYAIIEELKKAGYMEHLETDNVSAHDYNVYPEPQQRIIDKYADKKEQ